MGNFLLFLLVLGAIAFFVAKGYNALRQLAERVKESWANISVVTRKKIALINQLITVVSNYQESEKFVMLQVSADTVTGVQQATQESGRVLMQIGQMAQKFPELKANQQYNRLMDNMHATENEVQNARLNYNQNARLYNTARTSLPAALYAAALGFGPAEYLSLEAVESADSGVQQVMISDDSDRLNKLLGAAGSKAASAARQLGTQGKTLAERGIARIQQGAEEEQFSYIDGSGRPMGPVSRTELLQLFSLGRIDPQTSVMSMSAKSWSTYGEVFPPSEAKPGPGEAASL